MRCIFCRANSSGSRSIEHIIPESLGNVVHVLPRGLVCDACNNYFSREVERPFLETTWVTARRHHHQIASKRGAIPPVVGVDLHSKTIVELRTEKDGTRSITAKHERDEAKWVQSLVRKDHDTLIIPDGEPPADRVAARFLAKVALEVFASRLHEVPAGWDEIVDRPELDALRRFARHGDNFKEWPIAVRSLYPAGVAFPSDEGAPYEVLHEYMLLGTPRNEYFLILALFGVEFAINLGGPELDGYRDWLAANGQQSPLYPKGMPPFSIANDTHR